MIILQSTSGFQIVFDDEPAATGVTFTAGSAGQRYNLGWSFEAHRNATVEHHLDSFTSKCSSTTVTPTPTPTPTATTKPPKGKGRG